MQLRRSYSSSDPRGDAGEPLVPGRSERAGLYHSIFRIANMGAIADADLARLLGVFRKRFRARA